MIVLLALIPLLAACASLLLFRHNGKRQLLNFDIVQFIYSFVLMPVMFIWLKSFLFYIVRNELGGSLSVNEYLVIDTAFSILFMFISSFVVIHSLTKSFQLHRQKDPLVDLFELSEYFHMALSHFVIFIGILLIATLLSAVNLLIPISVLDQSDKPYSALGVGVLLGAAFQLGIFNYEDSRQFFRVIKLMYGCMFLFHVLTNFIIAPVFSVMYYLYWTFFACATTLVFLGLFAEPANEENPWWRPFRFDLRKGVSLVNVIKYVIHIFIK